MSFCPRESSLLPFNRIWHGPCWSSIKSIFKICHYTALKVQSSPRYYNFSFSLSSYPICLTSWAKCVHCFFEIVSSWNWKGASKKELLREYESLNRPPGFKMEHNMQSEAQARVWRIIECIRIGSNTNICSFDISTYICTTCWNLKVHESNTERNISNIGCRYIILELRYFSYKCFIFISSSIYILEYLFGSFLR